VLTAACAKDMHEKPNSAAATALRRNFDNITDIIAFPFRLVPNTLFTICLVAQLRALASHEQANAYPE
jgi:hypothetical protein